MWLLAVPCWIALCSIACDRRSSLPAALNDRDFWNVIESFSEPPGTFGLSDNFVSNEPRVAENVRWLYPTGGVYIGVGPEQNFSYIARLRPEMAFIIDIRRENRNLHLLYKALFELSSDRVDFVSQLFSRPRPADLRSTASVEAIFERYDAVPRSPEQYRSTSTRVRERLLTTHGFPLTQADLDWIDRAFGAFYTDGPEIQFWGSRAVDKNAVRPSYRRLMTLVDFAGLTRSFLAYEDGFRFVKNLQASNLIVPVVGDFGGPDAIHHVGEYAREHAAVVQAFYGSNVGVYLTNEQKRAFCRNLLTLPTAPGASFIESDSVRSLASKLKGCS